MSVLKKLSADTRKWACLIAAIAAMSVLVCTEPSDNCGQGRKLNAFTEFCYNGEAYPKCGGKDFNPPTEFCYEGEVLAKCGAEYNPVREFCYNKVIFAKCAGQEFTPDREFCFHNSDVYDKCNGEEFDPANGCNNEITLPKCGGFYINPQNEFCVNGVTYQLCNGNKYTPPNNPCGTGSLLTINIEPKGWGTVNVPLQQYYAPGTAVNVTATPVADSGGMFVGWSGMEGSKSDGSATITMSSDKTLTAYFRWPKLRVNVSPADAGSVSYNSNSEAYPLGTSITIMATPTSVSGYMFIGWSGESSSLETTVTLPIIMDNDKTLTANFKQPFTLTTNVLPMDGGTVSCNGCKPSHDPNPLRRDTVNVTATPTPASNYIFSHWSGLVYDVDTKNPIRIIMNDNKTLTANFVLVALTISVSPPDGGTVSYSPDQYTYYGQRATVTLTATPANKYELLTWSLGNNNSDKNPVRYDFDMSQKQTFIANFRQTGKIESENMVDTRDNKTYKTVMIGGAWFGYGSSSDGTKSESNGWWQSLNYKKRWMAENLNYQTTSGSWCYGNNNSNCNKYGRLYDWNTARTVCPTGWHLPSFQEWSELAMMANGKIGGSSDNGAGGSGGKILKATSPDWDGTDDYGFSVLPGGNRWPPGDDSNEKFNDVGKRGFWWTATDTMMTDGSHRAYSRDIGDVDGSGNGINHYADYIVNGYSVRCIEDD